MTNIVELLHAGEYSCVISNGEEVRTFTKPGIADLYELYTSEPSFLKRASIADKIVGKAAATLMILGGVENVYTDVISESAINLLKPTPIKVSFGKIVPFIENRDKTGICPLESSCSDTDSLQELYASINTFIEKMRR